MGLDCLPLEVLEEIATYLSAADLSHCLSVNRTWYNIFSGDLFWKRHITTKSSDYLSKAKCLVEPIFQVPMGTDLSIPKNRLQFLQEKHLGKNWELGRFKKEEIEFDCDDSIRYNIKVSFLDNDHVCLHRTYETEVWNVESTPTLVMTVPYRLKELWEENVYKMLDNNLVVIQCNVVQIYTINLDTQNSSLDYIFFFNKPESASSSLTSETDVDALFQLESFSEEREFQRIICGPYLVGANTAEESVHVHIWNVTTGKKIKVDTCDICTVDKLIKFKAPKVASDKVLVTFSVKRNSVKEVSYKGFCSIVYDLVQFQFLPNTQYFHYGCVSYFEGHWIIVDGELIKVNTNNDKMFEEDIPFMSMSLFDYSGACISSVEPLGSNFLISNESEVFLINPSEIIKQHSPITLNSLMKVNFFVYTEVLHDRYILLHEHCMYEGGIKEIWKLEKSLEKVLEFPPDSGHYVAKNNVCSKIVLERANKLIVLNFW